MLQTCPLACRRAGPPRAPVASVTLCRCRFMSGAGARAPPPGSRRGSPGGLAGVGTTALRARARDAVVVPPPTPGWRVARAPEPEPWSPEEDRIAARSGPWAAAGRDPPLPALPSPPALGKRRGVRGAAPSPALPLDADRRRTSAAADVRERAPRRCLLSAPQRRPGCGAGGAEGADSGRVPAGPTPLFPPQNELPDTRAKFHVLFLFFVSTMFFVSVLSLFSYHCWLVGKNRTTIGTWPRQGAGGRGALARGACGGGESARPASRTARHARP